MMREVIEEAKKQTTALTSWDYLSIRTFPQRWFMRAFDSMYRDVREEIINQLAKNGHLDSKTLYTNNHIHKFIYELITSIGDQYWIEYLSTQGLNDEQQWIIDCMFGEVKLFKKYLQDAKNCTSLSLSVVNIALITAAKNGNIENIRSFHEDLTAITRWIDLKINFSFTSALHILLLRDNLDGFIEAQKGLENLGTNINNCYHSYGYSHGNRIVQQEISDEFLETLIQCFIDNKNNIPKLEILCQFLVNFCATFGVNKLLKCLLQLPIEAIEVLKRTGDNATWKLPHIIASINTEENINSQLEILDFLNEWGFDFEELIQDKTPLMISNRYDVGAHLVNSGISLLQTCNSIYKTFFEQIQSVVDLMRYVQRINHSIKENTYIEGMNIYCYALNRAFSKLTSCDYPIVEHSAEIEKLITNILDSQEEFSIPPKFHLNLYVKTITSWCANRYLESDLVAFGLVHPIAQERAAQKRIREKAYIKLLQRIPREELERTNISGSNILHLVIQGESSISKILTYCVNNMNINALTTDENQYTPLMLAVKEKNYELCNLIAAREDCDLLQLDGNDQDIFYLLACWSQEPNDVYARIEKNLRARLDLRERRKQREQQIIENEKRASAPQTQETSTLLNLPMVEARAYPVEEEKNYAEVLQRRNSFG